MASSTALTLVNKVLSTTGDYAELASIASGPAGIGTRILNFINLVIAEVGRAANWPQLRVNATGAADGITGIMEWSGSEDVRSDGPVSVWVATYTQDPLEEVTPYQFDRIVGAKVYSGGPPAVFQRGVSSAGKMQVQLYPTPALGDTINVSAYRRPTQLVADTDTTDFDDDMIVTGALAHLDLYDGMDRGYVAQFKDIKRQLYTQAYGNTMYRTQPENYQ